MALVVPAVMSLRMDLHSHCIWGCMWGWSCVQRCTVVWWLAPLPHSKRVPGSTPGWGLSVWSLHVLPVYALVLFGYSGFLPLSKNMHVRLIGDSKLSLGVSVSVCVFACPVCLCVALWWTGDLSRVYPASRPMTAGIGSSPLATRPTD